MTDLVKRLRDGLKQCQELGIQYSPAQDLISDMADEIERLREALADLIEQADRGRHDEMGLFRACERARKELEGAATNLAADNFGLKQERDRLREALKRQLRHTLNSDLPRAVEDYNFGKRALEGK